ncbi:MAG: putative metal-binding motif-containing protein, partial [Myxococcota bacterium]|nr:putative metal-binding motif-containing protein [Myxococcota bacterium]
CDGETPADEEDGDGDGFVGCEDCDDGDPGVYPGAFEICDGVDGNCDGAVDDADNDGTGTADCDEALVVVSWGFSQVQDLCPETLDVLPDMEILALVEALTDVNLGALVVNEDELEGVFAAQLEEHPLVAVLNGGLPWGAGFFNDTLPALDKAVGEGIPLYVIGDDSADQIDDSALMPDLFGLESLTSSGTPGQVEVAVLDHPILEGAWGSVGPFAVGVDMDQAAAAADTTVVLTQADGGYPALATHQTAGATVVVQLFGLAASGDTCPVTSSGETATVARNTIDWLLE